MRDHPIPPVTEPLQYRAIGIVRGIYSPKDPNQFTRGRLIDLKGSDLEAVVLGRVLTLMRRHLDTSRLPESKLLTLKSRKALKIR